MAAEYHFVQDIARREISAILASSESLISDDLLLERNDRRKLAAVAEASWADLVPVYLDTPPSAPALLGIVIFLGAVLPGIIKPAMAATAGSRGSHSPGRGHSARAAG